MESIDDGPAAILPDDENVARAALALGVDPEPVRMSTAFGRDGTAFGIGLHPTTMLCLEMLEEERVASQPDSVLDVGTGSGVWGVKRFQTRHGSTGPALLVGAPATEDP